MVELHKDLVEKMKKNKKVGENGENENDEIEREFTEKMFGVFEQEGNTEGGENDVYSHTSCPICMCDYVGIEPTTFESKNPMVNFEKKQLGNQNKKNNNLQDLQQNYQINYTSSVYTTNNDNNSRFYEEWSHQSREMQRIGYLPPDLIDNNDEKNGQNIQTKNNKNAKPETPHNISNYQTPKNNSRLQSNDTYSRLNNDSSGFLSPMNNNIDINQPTIPSNRSTSLQNNAPTLHNPQSNESLNASNRSQGGWLGTPLSIAGKIASKLVDFQHFLNFFCQNLNKIILPLYYL